MAHGPVGLPADGDRRRDIDVVGRPAGGLCGTAANRDRLGGQHGLERGRAPACEAQFAALALDELACDGSPTPLPPVLEWRSNRRSASSELTPGPESRHDVRVVAPRIARITSVAPPPSRSGVLEQHVDQLAHGLRVGARGATLGPGPRSSARPTPAHSAGATRLPRARSRAPRRRAAGSPVARPRRAPRGARSRPKAVRLGERGLRLLRERPSSPSRCR